MVDFGNDFFLLMLNLSQYKRESTILRIYAESLNDLFPHLNISFVKDIEGTSEDRFEIGTTDFHFGYLQLTEKPTKEELSQLQNANQMVGIILQNIRQKKLLNNEKELLEQTVEDKVFELKRSKENFRITINSIGDAVIATDIKGKTTLMNPIAEKLTGWKFEDAKGKPIEEIFKIVNAQTGRKTENPVYQVLNTGKIVGLANHTKLISKDKKEYQIADSGAPIKDDEGEITGVVLVFRDVTKDYQNREKIKQSEELLSAVFNSIQDGISVLDKDLNIRYVNPVMEKWYSPNMPLTGKKCYECYHNRKEPCDPCPTLRALETGNLEKNIVSGLSNTDSGVEYLELFSYPMEDNETGEITGVVEFVRDITEQKRSNDALAKWQDLMQYIIKHDPNAITVLDKNLNHIFVSNRFLEDYKVQEENIIGKNHYEVFPEVPEKWREVHQRALGGEVVSSNDDFFIREDGSVEYTRWECRPWYESEHEIGGIILYTEVITEKVNIEEKLRESEGRFRNLFETMAQGVVYQDKKGNIISANPAAEKILGITLDQMQGRTSMDQRWKAVSEDKSELPGEQHPAMVALRTGESVENFIQGIYNPQKEDYVWIIVNSIPQFKKGSKKPYQVFSTFLDITERKNAEEKLQESEEKLRNIVEHSTNLFYSHTPDHQLTYVSPQSTHFFGCPPDEAKVKWTDFISNNPMNEIGVERTNKAIETGEPQPSYELELLNKKGKRLWVEVHEAPVLRDGKVVSVVGALIDITERKEAEKQLQEKEKRFKALFHKNSSVLLLIDPKTGEIQDANEKATDFYGYSREELMAMNIQQINVLSDKQVNEIMKEAIKQGKSYFIFSHRVANGTIRDVEVYTSKIVIQGKELLYSTIHDITEETRNRKRLQKGEEIAKIGHWEFDFNNKLVYSSRGARKIYGIDKETLTIEEVQKIPLKEYRPVMDRALKDLIEKKEPYDLEFQIKRPSDNKIVDIHSIGEYNQERNIVFGIIQDITDQKETEKELKRKNEELQAAEEELRASNEELRHINQRLEIQKQELKVAKNRAEESDKLKSTFLANMSHEIRTPMNGIMGFSQVLQEKEFPREKQKKFLNIIHSRTHHLLNIINDIVDISKIEAGQLKIHLQDFYVNDMLTELARNYREEIKNIGKQKLKLNIKKGLEKEKSYIHSDPTRVRQVLDNLLSNAVKFTEEGFVEFGYEKKGNEKLMFFVKDTGIGINQEDQRHIFERFRQADGGSTRQYEGTGLGLTISRNLIDLLGGDMWVESSEGEGTTFFFTIPYHRSKTFNREIDEDWEETAKYNWKDKTILIVEDDITSQEFIKEILKPTAADMIFSESGEEALKKVMESNHIDLILMDIRLPGASGIEITRKIREKDKEITVIAQTAHAMGDDREKCIQAGANDYIAKPIGVQNLLALLAQYL
jgi:PAS domain S-box-containing protein